MNERIEELWDKAAEDTMDQSWQSQTKFMERFAELIVKECADTAENCFVYWPMDGSLQRTGCANAIKKHFGVEESQGWICPKCGTDRTKEVCPKGHMAAVTGDCPMTAEAQ